MLPFDGKTIMCVQRNLLIISHRIVRVSKETLSGLLYRGVFDVIAAWQQGVWSIMAEYPTKGEKTIQMLEISARM